MENLSLIHHIAIIGNNYEKMHDFYVNKLGFELVDYHERNDDILFNVKCGNLVLEIFIKPNAPQRPQLPTPENQGLRHLAFQVNDVAEMLAEFDRLNIKHEKLRVDDFNQRKMAFFFDPSGQPLEIHE